MMGYFANGTEAELYEAQYCKHCVHHDNGNCPVITLHFFWNYDAVGEYANETKHYTLELFIPREGVVNKQCMMFYEKGNTEYEKV